MTPGGPMLMLGGGSEPAIRRAARLGLGMITQGGDPKFEKIYQEACKEYGNTPQLFVNPTGDAPTSCFIAEDVDRAWNELGPYLLHDAQMYAAWMGESGSISKSVAADVSALRAENGAYRIFTPEQAATHIRENGILMLQPLCGGLPPALAWQSLELLASKVLPAVKAKS
jgi:alkanesulfonate monooxygenase SsuD/methylene tetrahydromethanopterin reductase-like flavin-dependent oxidoreductase (luciferase family)